MAPFLLYRLGLLLKNTRVNEKIIFRMNYNLKENQSMNIKSIIFTKDQTSTTHILGKELKDYIIDALKHAGIDQAYILDIEKGSNITQVIDFISGTSNIVVINVDTPLITYLTINELIKEHCKVNSDITSSIIKSDKEVTYGKVHIIKTKTLETVLQGFISNKKKDCTYENILDIVADDSYVLKIINITRISDLLKINSKRDLARCTSLMKERINNNHMDNDVTLEDPCNTYIGPDVIIGPNTIIEPNVVLKGNTTIGEGCFIGNGTNVENSKIGNKVFIENSHIHDSFIGEGSHLGPFAYIRPNSKIGRNVRIGDFVEIKNANIGDNTKVSHLTYVGDADVGENVNFGCGSVLVNYDSINKHRSVIEDDAFIGCNTNLVSPVNIGKRAYTAAGSTITNDVPEESLGISRVRQTNKEGWVAYKYPKK